MSNLLIAFGFFLIISGLVIKLVEIKVIKWPLLPGDILIKKENFIFYFPLATSLIISVLISIIFWLISKK
jgi:cytochrome b subunit of formate dehydrogenase